MSFYYYIYVDIISQSIFTSAGKVILALTVLSMLIQLIVIVVLLVTAFTVYDENDVNKKRRVDRLTKFSTALILVLGLFEAIISGLQAYVSGKN